ncbi:hypothetical protein Bca4012_103722 [Brassica carinata]
MVVAGDGELGFDSERSLRNGYHIQGRQQARKLPNPDTGGEQLRKHLPRMFSLIRTKVGGSKAIRYRLVSTISDADQGSADVAFRTPLAPYEKSKFLGSGSMVARLKLKGIVEGHHQEWSLRLNLTQHGKLTRSVMPLDVLGARATLMYSASSHLGDRPESVNHRVFERKLRPKPYWRGHVCLGVTNRRPQSSRGYRTEAGLRVLRARLAKIRAKDARAS